MHGLRREPNVPHHWNARPDDAADRLGNGHAALELHGFGAPVLHELASRFQRLLAGHLEAHERHVDHQVGAPGGPRHHPRVVSHLVEGDR